MDDFALRAIERILDAVIGGISIYLGYRLFLSVPRSGADRDGTAREPSASASANAVESSAEFKLPGDFSIILTRVGPGIFFALFGAAVVVTSLSKGMTYHHEPAAGGAGIAALSASGGTASPVGKGATDWHGYLSSDKSGGTTDWSGAIGADKADATPRLSRDRIVAQRRDLAPQIAALNAIVPALKADIDPGRKADIELAIPAIKRTLMHPVWDTDWGDEAAFDEWASNGAGGAAPDGCDQAAKFFNQ